MYYNDAFVIYNNENLLTELVYSEQVEGKNIKKVYKGSTDTKMKKLYNALKYNFSYLDIVRGQSIWEIGYIINMETNLKAIFKRIYDKLSKDKQSIYKSDTRHYYLSEMRWNTNREYIWKALFCGAQINADCCGGMIPNIDYIPQFLW